MALVQGSPLHRANGCDISQGENLALARVPKEILCHILSYLDRPALKAMRLTSRDIAAYCIRYLYSDIGVVVSFDRFSGARSIVRVPHLANAVRSITFSTGLVPRVLSSKELHRTHHDGDYASETPMTIQDEHRKHAKGLQEQQRFSRHKDDAQVFADILSHLGGVRSITITLGAPSVFGRNRPSFTALSNLSIPSTCRALKALLDSLDQRVTLAPRELKLEVFDFMLAQAFSVTSLDANPHPRHWTQTLTNLDLRIASRRTPGRSNPPNLQPQVDSPDDMFQDCYWLSFGSNLGEFIAALPNLRGLSVIFRDRYCRADERGNARPDRQGDLPYYRAGLSDILKPGFRWHRLERLCLGNIACRSRDLWDVLLQHGSSLRRVGLYSMCLYHMSWCDLVRNMKSHLKLERVAVAGRGLGRRPSGELEVWGFIDGHDTPWPPGPHASKIAEIVKDKSVDETKKVSVREYLEGDGKWELEYKKCTELYGCGWEIDSWDVIS